MKPIIARTGAVLCALLVGLSPACWAASPASDPPSAPVAADLSSAPLLLAQAGDAPPTAIDQALGHGNANRPDPAGRWLTPNRLHQYLGVAAITLAAATAMSFGLAEEEDEGPLPPGAEREKDGGLHGALAVATTTAAVGAVVTGIAVHHDDVGLGKPLADPDNLHMLLTLAGTAGLATATAMEGDGGHSAFGIGGGLAMLAGIKLTW